MKKMIVIAALALAACAGAAVGDAVTFGIENGQPTCNTTAKSVTATRADCAWTCGDYGGEPRTFVSVSWTLVDGTWVQDPPVVRPTWASGCP